MYFLTDQYPRPIYLAVHGNCYTAIVGCVLVIMASKPKRAKPLPDPFEIMRREEVLVTKMRESLNCIRSLHLCEHETLGPVSSSLPLSEDEIAVWLFSRYGVECVLNVCRLCCEIPASGLTTKQRLGKIVSSHPQTSSHDVQFIVETVESRCQNLLSWFAKSASQDECLVLCPPTNTCYYCNANLVLYHQCNVRLYSTSGVRKGEKITLRCKQCSIVYNYARYGSMNENGSRFYETARDAIEVSDTLFLPSSPGTSVQPCVSVL